MDTKVSPKRPQETELGYHRRVADTLKSEFQSLTIDELLFRLSYGAANHHPDIEAAAAAEIKNRINPLNPQPKETQ